MAHAGATGLALCALIGAASCKGTTGATSPGNGTANTPAGGESGTGSSRLPLVAVSDVPLPGGATRFDYQDIDTALGHVVVAHMNDGSVLISDLRDGSLLSEVRS